MWEEQIFEKGQVKVNTTLTDMTAVLKKAETEVPSVEGAKFYLLDWSVERL